ncbi:unnamed protein product [Microthlaspi erraticum]|uniref:RNase H type-1 domain-containing protein n=1 Tax=Microthlaspi erraticum TaxID=1685480 RepID=A0A6D2JK26_9BRAS|nr:unnamed protein product [Microthlaspi erraticum]
MGRLISEESGIGATRDLGKYLGMPVLQRRINKDTFGEVLEKVTSRLAGWKSQMLSLAGRITLRRSMLSSIPVHTMSTIVLPHSTVARLERNARSFLWGDTVEHRKQHLVAWEKVCTPKSKGGLGIRRIQEMNTALLAKLGWRLIHDETSLWARVLRSKYKVVDVRDEAWFTRKGNFSSTWRSILKGMREVVIPGISWVIGDGTSVRFWKDRWLSQTPMIEEVITTPTAELMLDEFTGARDRPSWGQNENGEFTVKSAYSILTRDMRPKPNMQTLFTGIWRAVVPERTRVFLWLVANHSIMTNLERRRRHITDTSLYQVCKGGEESTMHILRDCPAMAGIWTRIVPVSKQREFFTAPILNWLHDNIGNNTDMGGHTWSTLFAISTWWGWKWRCWNVFGNSGKCKDRVKFLKNLATEVFSAHVKLRQQTSTCVREERHIAWTKPENGWWKMNTDGASRGNPGLAAAGGILRDDRGAWVCGFGLNIGVCSAPLAELWGVYYGLYTA